MLNSDIILERQSLKKKVSFWRTLAFVIIAIILVSIATEFGSGKVNTASAFGGYIARIEIDGEIDRDKDRDEAIKDIIEDDKVKAVIIHVNSPGGTAVGGEDLYKRIKELSGKKPVVVVMGSMATSAAYLISVGADRIYAHNGTITGSIGVILQMPNVKDLMDKVGIKFDYIRTSPLKGAPNPFELKNDQANAILETMIKDFYNYFVKIVATERKLKFDDVKALADGRIYSAEEAKKNKLIDDIGGEDEAVNWLVENKSISKDTPVVDVKLTKPESPLKEYIKTITDLPKFSAKSGIVSVWPQ
jgi:protease-4